MLADLSHVTAGEWTRIYAAGRRVLYEEKTGTDHGCRDGYVFCSAAQPFAEDSGWIESADMQDAGQLAADGEERQTIDYGSTESYFWINAEEGVTLTPVLLGTVSDDYRYEWYSVDEQGENTRIEGAVSDTYETGALIRELFCRVLRNI